MRELRLFRQPPQNARNTVSTCRLSDFQRHERQENSRISRDDKQHKQCPKTENIENPPRPLHRSVRQLRQAETTGQRARWHHKKAQRPPETHLRKDNQKHHRWKKNQGRNNRQRSTHQERPFPRSEFIHGMPGHPAIDSMRHRMLQCLNLSMTQCLNGSLLRCCTPSCRQPPCAEPLSPKSSAATPP